MIQLARNVQDGLLILIKDKWGSLWKKYVDDLCVLDQIFIYRRLLKIDIYKKMKQSYPEMSPKNLQKLTNIIFNDRTSHKKIVHRS